MRIDNITAYKFIRYNKTIGGWLNRRTSVAKTIMTGLKVMKYVLDNIRKYTATSCIDERGTRLHGCNKIMIHQA